MNDENIDYAVKTIEFKLEEKAISEDGRFSGLAAVYNNVDGGGAVSYTHLTLPTIYSV